MKRVIIVGENFYGSIMVNPLEIPLEQLGVRVVNLWDEFQRTQPEADHYFIPWLAQIQGFGLDQTPSDVEIVIV
jgi:hypothetical protein